MLKKSIGFILTLVVLSIASLVVHAEPMIDEPLYSYHITNKEGSINVMAMGIIGSPITMKKDPSTMPAGCHLDSLNPLYKDSIDIPNDPKGESTSIVFYPFEISDTDVTLVDFINYTKTTAGTSFSVNTKCTIDNTTSVQHTIKKVIKVPLNRTSIIELDKDISFYIKVEKSS